jgi:hypothetical protein
MAAAVPILAAATPVTGTAVPAGPRYHHARLPHHPGPHRHRAAIA